MTFNSLTFNTSLTSLTKFNIMGQEVLVGCGGFSCQSSVCFYALRVDMHKYSQ